MSPYLTFPYPLAAPVRLMIVMIGRRTALKILTLAVILVNRGSRVSTGTIHALRLAQACPRVICAVSISTAVCSPVLAQTAVNRPLPPVAALHFFLPTPKSYEIVGDCGRYQLILRWRFDGRTSMVEMLQVDDREVGLSQLSELNEALARIGGDVLARVDCHHEGVGLTFIGASSAGNAHARQVQYNLIEDDLIEVRRFNLD